MKTFEMRERVPNMVPNQGLYTTLLSNDKLFMNINENIRNEKKNMETLVGCTYTTTHISAATYHKLQTLVPNQSLVNS